MVRLTSLAGYLRGSGGLAAALSQGLLLGGKQVPKEEGVLRHWQPSLKIQLGLALQPIGHMALATAPAQGVQVLELMGHSGL